MPLTRRMTPGAWRAARRTRHQRRAGGVYARWRARATTQHSRALYSMRQAYVGTARRTWRGRTTGAHVRAVGLGNTAWLRWPFMPRCAPALSTAVCSARRRGGGAAEKEAAFSVSLSPGRPAACLLSYHIGRCFLYTCCCYSHLLSAPASPNHAYSLSASLWEEEGGHLSLQCSLYLPASLLEIHSLSLSLFGGTHTAVLRLPPRKRGGRQDEQAGSVFTASHLSSLL